MNAVVVYDVSTVTEAGRRRLRQVAKICEGYGQRVQWSVFEVTCSPTDMVRLRSRLAEAIDQSSDSIRIYLLGADGFDRLQVIGRSHDHFEDAEPWTI